MKTRSRFLLWLATALYVVGCMSSSTMATQPGKEDSTRKILFSWDGDSAWGHILAGKSSEREDSEPVAQFSKRILEEMIDDEAAVHVDALAYCLFTAFRSDLPSSKVTDLFPRRPAGMDEAGIDMLKVLIDRCHHHNMQFIAGIRMNDRHTALPNGIAKDHPEWALFGGAFDYALEPVRQAMLDFNQEVLDGYDVDGIDLDFQRHICYFKETRRYEPVTAEHCDMLTDLVGKIRKEVLAASERKGRPILLSARVLAKLEQNRRFGLDLEKWADNGYLDFITTGCGYDPFTMPDDMIRQGHAWGMPVYRCFSHSAMLQEQVKHTDLLPGNLAAWRAVAANAWHDGVDGVMSFNLFPHLPGTPQTEIARTAWREMGDPEGLVGKDKLYCIEHLHYDDNCYLFKSVPREGRLPVTISKGTTVTRDLPVADDISGLADRIEKLRLRICLAGFEASDKINVKMNGAELAVAPEEPLWVVAEVPPEVMKQGKNALVVAFTSGKADSLVMQSVELTVDYK